MKAYLAFKFKEDMSNRDDIEAFSDSLNRSGVETSILIRDYENWGEKVFSATELMDIAFKEIDSSDIVIVEFSEKGVGLGIEAGYAYAKGKPVYVIAKNGSEISKTLQGIAREIVSYDSLEDLRVSAILL